jgi:predicted lipoprotein with Yx(FWY)xxD motif
MQLKNIIKLSIPFVVVYSFLSCSKNGGSGSTTPPPTTSQVSLKTDSKFGSILTDADGKSLYFFALDANGNSDCTGSCSATWPPFSAGTLTNVSAGLNIADFGTITRSDGLTQTTYKGWPLYHYAGDVTSGGSGAYGNTTPITNTISGDGIGGIWFVAKPDYTVMLAKTQLTGMDGVLYDSTYHPNTGLTLYMTDDRGVTLYSFSEDSSANNNYTLPDFSNDAFWPIVQLSAIQNVPSVLSAADFSSITVFGKPQLTYKGWPVYRFGPDALVRGSNKGISVPSPGVWPVMDQASESAPH